MLRFVVFGALASIAASASAVTVTDNFSYANEAAFNAVYTPSGTAVGGWVSSFDGNKITVTNSVPDTGGFDSFYARRPIGNIAGNFSAKIDMSWLSANEPGERSRMALHVLTGDGTGVQPAGLTAGQAWTFENDVASVGIWNDYGVYATSMLVDGKEDPTVAPANFPWRPEFPVGTSGNALLSIRRSGQKMTLTYDDGTVKRSYSSTNADAITHIGLFYSHYTGSDPGLYDGSAAFSLDNLLVYTPPTPVAGDADRNGLVNINDYQLIQAHAFEAAPFGPTALGDLNDDEFVDFADFQIWKTSFPGGVAAAEAAIAAIPEPSAIALTIPALAAFLLKSRRKASR